MNKSWLVNVHILHNVNICITLLKNDLILFAFPNTKDQET